MKHFSGSDPTASWHSNGSLGSSVAPCRYGFRLYLLFAIPHEFIYLSFSRCVEYGVLPEPEAERLYKMILKRKGKSMPSAASPAPPMAKKKRKPKLMDDEGFDPDMQVSSGDAIGRAVL